MSIAAKNTAPLTPFASAYLAHLALAGALKADDDAYTAKVLPAVAEALAKARALA